MSHHDPHMQRALPSNHPARRAYEDRVIHCMERDLAIKTRRASKTTPWDVLALTGLAFIIALAVLGCILMVATASSVISMV